MEWIEIQYFEEWKIVAGMSISMGNYMIDMQRTLQVALEKG